MNAMLSVAESFSNAQRIVEFEKLKLDLRASLLGNWVEETTRNARTRSRKRSPEINRSANVKRVVLRRLVGTVTFTIELYKVPWQGGEQHCFSQRLTGRMSNHDWTNPSLGSRPPAFNTATS